jgi:hypothetical protein
MIQKQRLASYDNSGFHRNCTAKQQTKQARQIHSGVDINEGRNAMRGMFIGCVMTAVVAIVVVTIMVLV